MLRWCDLSWWRDKTFSYTLYQNLCKYSGRNGVCKYACCAVTAVTALSSNLQKEAITYYVYFKHGSRKYRRCIVYTIFGFFFFCC
jgi:hypothetical protein